jgi:predicted transcriptional regulator
VKKNEYITFRTDENVKNKLLDLAEKEDRTLSYIVNRILKNYLEGESEKKECSLDGCMNKDAP